MMKRVTLSVLLLIITYISMTSIIGIAGLSSSGNYTEIADTLMAYEYDTDLDLTPIMRSNASFGLKLKAVMDFYSMRNNENKEINISAMYDDNKENDDIVVPTIREGKYDDRLTKRGGSYFIKVKDLAYINGYDYVLYDNHLVKLRQSDMPVSHSQTRGNTRYKYNLVEVVSGHEDSIGLDYMEYRYNPEVGIYGEAIRLYINNGRVVNYRVL